MVLKGFNGRRITKTELISDVFANSVDSGSSLIWVRSVAQICLSVT